MNKFAVFDIDGTLIRWQLYHVMATKLAKTGALGAEAQTKLKDALMTWKRREDQDSFKQYEKLLVELYENALQRISAKQFDKLALEVINEYKDQTYSYTRNLLKKLKGDGYMLFIISGSHEELVEQIGKYYGFDDWIGTVYERAEDTFSGKMSVAAHNKDQALRLLVERNSVTLSGSIGIGDTKSDAAMLEIVERPIAFNPDKSLLAVAKEKGWKIVIERKNVVYELEQQNGKYQLLA